MFLPVFKWSTKSNYSLLKFRKKTKQNCDLVKIQSSASATSYKSNQLSPNCCAVIFSCLPICCLIIITLNTKKGPWINYSNKSTEKPKKIFFESHTCWDLISNFRSSPLWRCDSDVQYLRAVVRPTAVGKTCKRLDWLL